MYDFTDIPMIDHHCHPYENKEAFLDPIFLARTFLHGIADIPKADPGLKPNLWDATEELQHHFTTMGVVQAMVCQLAKVLDCPADLTAVAEERNRRTGESFKDYIKLLYYDARIVGTALDTGLPVNDPLLGLIPGLRLRLFQMDPAIQELLPQTDSYEIFLKKYQERLDRAVRENKFIGVKAQLAERVGFHARPVSSDEAENVFAAARCLCALLYSRRYELI